MQDFLEERVPTFEEDFSEAKRQMLARQEIASLVVEDFIRTAPPCELEKLKKILDKFLAEKEGED